MQRALRRHDSHDSVVYHVIDGGRVDGPPPGVWGDLSGVRGNLTGVRGDLDKCDLTDEDRERGVEVADLIAADAETTGE